MLQDFANRAGENSRGCHKGANHLPNSEQDRVI